MENKRVTMATRLLKLELILAGLLFFIPVLLMVICGEVRPSISDYAYAQYPSLLPTLLTLAGSVFIYNGVINRSKWYNIALGCSLIGIGNTPHLDYPIMHYCFAGLFFVGSVIVMLVYSSKRQLIIKVPLTMFLIGALLNHFLFDKFSLFVAEWIALIPICIHFIGESTGKLD